MNNQTDLDWLARNVHEWPENGPKPIFSKNKWLARRAELQNKPSWADAPEWAEWLAQHASGYWCWGEGNPCATEKSWEGVGADWTTQWAGMAGEVLGDWRDTLERRPADMSDPAVTERLDEATQTVLAAAPGMMDEKYRFDRNDWYERGELPPVGVVCETLVEPELQWVAVEVLAHRDGFAIVWVASEKCGAQCDDPKDFRPIRTEREKAVDEMMKCTLGVMNQETQRRLFEDLYDAGYRKESK